MGDVVLNQETHCCQARISGGVFRVLVDRSALPKKKQYAEKFPDNPFISYRRPRPRVDSQLRLPGSRIGVFTSRKYRQSVHGPGR